MEQITKMKEYTSPSNERTRYLKRYVSENLIPYRILNYGRLRKLSKCIGITGPRGSCKSVTAAAMGILDGMIPGSQLISNMGVKYAVKVGKNIVQYQSEELDKAAVMNFDIDQDVYMLIDEVNIEFSESRRSMTNRNLIFNKILQQLRKRKLNLIYTVQHEMWVDNRLRWQTDFFIRCQDVCLRPGGNLLPYDFGEYAALTVFDMSGFLGHGSYQDTGRPVIENWRFHAKPWWKTYDTALIQGIEEPVEDKGIELSRSKYIVQGEQNKALVYDTIMDLHNQGITDITSENLYQIFGINTHQGKMYIGNLLKDMGVPYIKWNNSYRIPDFDLDKPETMINSERTNYVPT